MQSFERPFRCFAVVYEDTSGDICVQLMLSRGGNWKYPMKPMQMSCTRCTRCTKCTRSTRCTSAVCREPENVSTIHSLSITSLHWDAEGCTTGGDLSDLLNLQLDKYYWSWFSSLDFLCWAQESNPMDPSIGIQNKRSISIESARHQTGSDSL